MKKTTHLLWLTSLISFGSAQAGVTIRVDPSPDDPTITTAISVSGDLPSILLPATSSTSFSFPITALSLGNNNRFGFISGNSPWDLHSQSSSSPTIAAPFTVVGELTNVPANFEIPVEITGLVLAVRLDGGSTVEVLTGSDGTFTINQNSHHTTKISR